jgi:hypothetical protein
MISTEAALLKKEALTNKTPNNIADISTLPASLTTRSGIAAVNRIAPFLPCMVTSDPSLVGIKLYQLLDA